jgi:hypothetical protein
MTVSNPRLDIPFRTLKLGRQLGKGGEGEVFDVANQPGYAFKRYFRSSVNGQSLRMLADFPASLDDYSRDKLLTQTAWPLACVTDGGAVIGFIMNKVPAPFFGETEAGKKLRELQYLLYPPKPMWGSITPLGSVGRLDLARAFITLMRILHDNSTVLGDISMLNLLWSPGSPARLFLIDCDSARRSGHPPVLQGAPQTPDWEDPKMPPTGPDIDTDCYKAALVIGRILAAVPSVRPGEPLRLLPDIPQNIADPARACFDRAAGAYGTRPDLSQWAQALSGREMIALTPASPLPPPPDMPKAILDTGRGTRETTPLPPFGSRP